MVLPFIIAAALTAETSRPNCSFYEFGAPVEATFTATGLKPGEERTLNVDVVDDTGREIAQFVGTGFKLKGA